MTFYEEEINRIRSLYLPKEYLVNRIIAAKQFIDQHAANEIDLTAIAGKSMLSKFHFVRLFKTCYGKTPHQYLTTMRMIKAKALLEQGASTTDACYALNFKSVPSFITLFKKSTGHSPAAWKQKSNFR